MSTRDLCQLSGLARARLYRKPKPESERARRVRQAIVNAALDHPAYGTRRTTHQLRRQQLTVNRKRVQRVMREENLLRRSRRGARQTTDSKHELRRYPNLAREFRPTGLNQLWGSDISYVRLRNQFVYVAVVLDVFSRRVVGWAVGPNMKTELPLAALREALSSRGPAPGWMHHCDQGSQYASEAYVATLRQDGAKISMSRKGRPQDNAFVESFFKTLKTEEVECNEYESLTEAQAQIGAYIEREYNRTRLHSSLGYRPPEEYERLLEEAADAA
jgi:transposase InsO family protein